MSQFYGGLMSEAKNELVMYAEKHFKDCLEILKAKNSDYACNETPLKNFLLVEKLGICSTPEGILVRMCDKLSRIINFLETKNLKVTDETIHDTIKDLINYTIILSFAIDETIVKPKNFN